MIKIINIAKRLIAISLILMSISSSAIAQNSQQESSNKAIELMDSTFSTPIKLTGEDKEYAHVWFAQIFGEFIYTPWDEQYKNGTVTLVSKAVGFTNILAMFLGLVLVYYIIVGGALNTANHGEALGKQWSAVWIPIRTATGFFLITPITTIGGGVLSFAQIFIIWVILMGSNAASFLWKISVEEIANGGTINAPNIPVGAKPTMDIAKMLMCTEYYIRNKGNNGVRNNVDNNIVAELIFKTANGEGRHVVYAETLDPQIDRRRISGSGLGEKISALKPNKIYFANNGDCGSIIFDVGDSTKGDEQLRSDYKVEASIAGYRRASEMIGEVVSELTPQIIKLTNYGTGPQAITAALASDEDSPHKATFQEVTAAINNTASKFAQNLVGSMRDAMVKDSDVSNLFKEDMMKGGWGKAGIWFFEIGAIPSLTYKVFNGVMGGISPKEVSMCTTYIFSFKYKKQACEEMNAEYQSATSLIGKIKSELITINKGSGPSDSYISEGDTIAATCDGQSVCSIDSNIISQYGVRHAKAILNTLATSASDDPVGDTSGLSSPFETVTSIGHTMNQMAMGFWALGLITNTLAESLSATASGGPGAWTVGPLLGGLAGAAKWILLTITMAISAAFGAGFVLAYVIPFMPIITWIMMMTGYLITVVEAVVAAPLAIILMVTPEGEGIAGTRLERAMQLLAMAILKPSLMIIGLITAITISAVGFAILNEFFFLTAEYVLYGSFIDFIPVMLIYVSACLNMCKMLIGVMHTLPTQILEWFSSGSGRSFGETESGHAAERSMGDIKSSIGSMGSGLGSAIGASVKKGSDRKNKKDTMNALEKNGENA